MVRRLLPPLGLAAALLALWEAYVAASGIAPVILPAPSAVAKVMLAEAPKFLVHAWTTSIEVVVGFVLATALGAALGVVIALSRPAGAAIYPLIIAAQVMPKVAIAPLLIIWLGFDLGPKIALTTLIAFFPIVVNTVVGMGMVRRETYNLFLSLGATGLQIFWKLRVPAALPVFFGGLKIASTLAVIGAVVGEFMGANAGLGYLLTVYVGNAGTVHAFAGIMYLTILGLCFFLLVVIVERLIVQPHLRTRVVAEAAQS
ncbi:MAG: ABC transporter permease [Candidatus Odyssella sp.]|nr:ABC transporter permease [Candidatus Odyssella sp.]